MFAAADAVETDRKCGRVKHVLAQRWPECGKSGRSSKTLASPATAYCLRFATVTSSQGCGDVPLRAATSATPLCTISALPSGNLAGCGIAEADFFCCWSWLARPVTAQGLRLASHTLQEDVLTREHHPVLLCALLLGIWQEAGSLKPLRSRRGAGGGFARQQQEGAPLSHAALVWACLCLRGGGNLGRIAG